MLYTFLICFIAGIGAGLGTGFAGMSAAAVISPMLITFLGMEPYMAVGIALASDVLASAVSAYTYGKHNNLDIRNGIVMMIFVLLFTLVGSYVSALVPGTAMGGFSTFMTLLLGIKFIVRPVMTTKSSMEQTNPRKRLLQSMICGAMVGFICGFIGAGGGMMMLLILTSVLGYELKTAVGTSVFIMAFTAFTGAASHFTIGGMPDMTALILCIASTCGCGGACFAQYKPNAQMLYRPPFFLYEENSYSGECRKGRCAVSGCFAVCCTKQTAVWCNSRCM